MELRVGCPMWANKAWQGTYLPDKLARREQLPAYASWCNAVEGNTTYYGVPKPSTVDAWARETPWDFRFVFKLPSSITHQHRLRDVGADLAELLRTLEPLGDRAEQLSIQLPKSFGPKDLGALGEFVRRLPTTHRFGVEIRHRSFFEESVPAANLERILTAAGVEWIVLDTTTLYADDAPSDAARLAKRQKPLLPQRTVALTDHPIVRFVGTDDPARTRAGWQPWVAVVEGWLREGRSPTVFVHTPDNLHSLALARQFHANVRAVVSSLEPLPEPRRPEQPPEPTLF
ncbi:MAG: DUF72 domain-containing protein [Ilumatobacteraceae bacterium]